MRANRFKVTAYSLDNTVEWVSGTTVAAAGEYDLLRVITTPQAISSTTHLVTGDAVTAEAQSKRADSNTINGVKVEDGVAFSWFAADTADGQFTQLEGVEGANITVPAAAAGKYLKVVATSGSSHVETVFANKVLDRDSVDAVVQKLSDKNVKPAPVYGNDTNLNSVLEAKIAELGFQGVTAKVDSVQFVSASDKATVGVSAADDDGASGKSDLLRILVHRTQELQPRQYPFRLFSRNPGLTVRPVLRWQHKGFIAFLPQLLYGNITSHFHSALKFHAHNPQNVDLRFNHILFQSEGRDPVHQHASGSLFLLQKQ